MTIEKATVVQPTIPNVDMTPLERLLLSQIFIAEPDGDGLYFFSEDGPSDMLLVNRAELDAVIASSQYAGAGVANTYVKEQLEKPSADEKEVELDLSGTSWEFFFQDIVRRSTTLQHITVVSSFYCSKMRPDGFGGMASLITADFIKGKSTADMLNDFFDEAEHGPPLAAAGFGVHVLLSLEEKEVRAQIAVVIEANDALTKITAEAVTNADIRAACLLTVERTDLAKERGSAIFKTAVRAIHEAEQRRATVG